MDYNSRDDRLDSVVLSLHRVYVSPEEEMTKIQVSELENTAKERAGKEFPKAFHSETFPADINFDNYIRNLRFLNSPLFSDNPDIRYSAIKEMLLSDNKERTAESLAVEFRDDIAKNTADIITGSPLDIMKYTSLNHQLTTGNFSHFFKKQMEENDVPLNEWPLRYDRLLNRLDCSVNALGKRIYTTVSFKDNTFDSLVNEARRRSIERGRTEIFTDNKNNRYMLAYDFCFSDNNPDRLNLSDFNERRIPIEEVREILSGTEKGFCDTKKDKSEISEDIADR